MHRLDGRGLVGRADLLRLLADFSPSQVTLDDGLQGWFGFLPRPEPETRPEFDGGGGTAETATSFAGDRLPLQLPSLLQVIRREARTQLPLPPAESEAAPLDADALAPQSAIRKVAYEALIPPARLFPQLHHQIGVLRPGRLDVAVIVRAMVEGRLREPLPRKLRRRWSKPLIVVLDWSERLICFRHDMNQLALGLLRACGDSSLSLRVMRNGPSDHWSDWREHQSDRRHRAVERPWRLPPEGTQLLLVSDFGLLQGEQGACTQHWMHFIARLQRAGGRATALAPISQSQLPAYVARQLPVLRWSPNGGKSPCRGSARYQAEPPGLTDLLAMVSALRRVDPPLLRALRRLGPVAPLDAGLEGALCCHPDIRGDWAVSVRPDRQAAHQDRFAQLQPALRQRLDQLRREHHVHLHAVLWHEETLLWASTWTLDRPAKADQVADSVQWLRRLAASLREERGSRAGDALFMAAHALLERADHSAMSERYQAPLLELASALQAVRPQIALPAFVDPALLPNPAGVPTPVWLVRDAAHAELRLQLEPPMLGQSALDRPIKTDARGLQLKGHGQTRTLSLDSLPHRVVSIASAATIEIRSALESIIVAPVQRPRGCEAWGRGRNGLFVETAPLAGHIQRFGAEQCSIFDQGVLQCSPRQVLDEPGLGLQFGIDEYGCYADLRIANATQRLRWIEPGEFWMGSPEDDAERYEDEGPQHRVRISEGFWLADSACTQALWLAVMGGKNPSEFAENPQNPVVRVSWDDVQAFLQRLQKRLPPGSELALPTEAQWEYACRAGTTAPFNLGANISTDQVNYGGDFPFASGAKRKFRGRTVPVKSLPPNRWGLFEMHGNVWEWCADGKRDYGLVEVGEVVVDPIGPTKSAPGDTRAARGGSWLEPAQSARCAYRRQAGRVIRSKHLGFRLALRPTIPGRPEGARPEARGTLPAPASKRRDAASTSEQSRPRRSRKKT